MARWRWFGLLVVVVILTLAMAAPAAAAPPDDDDPLAPEKLPPGLGLKIFIHYPKDSAHARPGQDAPSAVVGTCEGTEYGNATCDMYGYSNISWKTVPAGGIPYYVNPNFNSKKSPRLTKDGAVAGIRASFAAWDGQSTKLLYADKGVTSTKPGRLDGKNVVGWGNLQPGALAATKVWYYTSNGQIAQFDIIFNNSYSWSYTAPEGYGSCGSPDSPWCDPTNSGTAGTYDVRDIGTHEAGHTLMLDDLYDAGASDVTMYGYGATAELKKDTLGNGDILGVKAIYP